MSEKKQKEVRNTIDVPIYDLQNQFQYIIDFCKPFEFSPQTMLSLIVADWIELVQTGLVKKIDEKDIFISYLEHCQKIRKSFDKLKKQLEKKENE